MSPVRPRAAFASLLLLALLAASPFSGCGGTSVDTGNPGLELTFRKDGEPAAFQGFVQIYAHDADPAFHVPGRPDGGRDVRDADADGRNARYLCCGSREHYLDLGTLASGAGYRVSLPLLPAYYDDQDEDAGFGSVSSPAAPGEARAFNLVFHDEDRGLYAIVRNIVLDAGGRLRDSTGDDIGKLDVDLLPAGDYIGVLDTTGLGGSPLVVYSPGSQYHARVHGDRFRFRGVPLAPLPVRLVTRTGAVHAFAEPLAITRRRGEYVPDNLPALVPGGRVDSLELPEPLETLASPKATPAGPHDFTDSLVVALTAAPGAVIYYTTGDTAMPGTHSKQYDRPLVLRSTTSVRAVAYREGSYHSPVSVNEFYRVPEAPRAQPASRAFRDTLRVILTASARDGAIHYTLDGSAPTPRSPRYSGSLLLDTTTTLKAITVVSGIRPSDALQEFYPLVTDSLPPESP